MRAIADEMPALAAFNMPHLRELSLAKVAREPNRYSGRTAMLANISVHEPKPPEDPDSALRFPWRQVLDPTAGTYTFLLVAGLELRPGG